MLLDILVAILLLTKENDPLNLERLGVNVFAIKNFTTYRLIEK